MYQDAQFHAWCLMGFSGLSGILSFCHTPAAGIPIVLVVAHALLYVLRFRGENVVRSWQYLSFNTTTVVLIYVAAKLHQSCRTFKLIHSICMCYPQKLQVIFHKPTHHLAVYSLDTLSFYWFILIIWIVRIDLLSL